ncbi:hypothetical protein BS47DRAFT_1365797 [Hydnum rufescens UP504]|uniref:Uncharacterized protein n=1 Tax=Hydnum rufescens UP504 TaxID=1448309 RepID=A0A9P6AMN7_9AGAM|nr:hypothetical protein BS47DRAFT_1365797 [Hydnum rufescens UP504]
MMVVSVARACLDDSVGLKTIVNWSVRTSASGGPTLNTPPLSQAWVGRHCCLNSDQSIDLRVLVVQTDICSDLSIIADVVLPRLVGSAIFGIVPGVGVCDKWGGNPGGVEVAPYAIKCRQSFLGLCFGVLLEPALVVGSTSSRSSWFDPNSKGN